MNHQHEPLIKLDKVNLHFGRNHVLQDITTELHKGCITTLIGPNGAGKTTLVRVILGLIKPSSGSIWQEDNLRIGYMPQKLQIDQTFPLTVERFLQTAQTANKETMIATLTDVGAESLFKQSIHNLSGGEMQRILLARALLRNPHLLVLDEPVQGVDINGQLELYNLISRIRDERGCGVLMISHDLHLVMASTDHVICINHHVCCSGHPEHVTNDPSFTELFGIKGSEQLAVYSHHHNHRHDEHGDVIPDPACDHSHNCNHDQGSPHA
ncbi:MULTISPECIES: zinc ABC transporter ATP-binding protein ZnuC [unclassified Neptuniibacter]|uniref:zinc ABC transporter ATP-binding protein ZnuC n=1 Tax=unclassified Neptuniibacter TaxID=2630693 RepID=UPI000C3CBC4D|nr:MULTISPECIES: zinc ABC transporter ATP-binding protein ZnuC [unclassified Neptuniibacter]MAY42692.1 zinc ABC transporter ATP-binding protein ZnuC [Oceanospirillaceae bacterium]|tara:strand:+ start:11666 stop:12469 length:804 start_codon:yes stop_codon:yes gene_type:complete